MVIGQFRGGGRGINLREMYELLAMAPELPVASFIVVVLPGVILTMVRTKSPHTLDWEFAIVSAGLAFIAGGLAGAIAQSVNHGKPIWWASAAYLIAMCIALFVCGHGVKHALWITAVSAGAGLGAAGAWRFADTLF